MGKEISKTEVLADQDLSDVAAGISVYESSEGVNRDSWFVTLMSRLMGREQPAQNSVLPVQQTDGTPGAVPEPPEVMRGNRP